MSDVSRRVSIRKWVSGRLPVDVRQTLDRLARAPDVRYVAVMPDVHLAGEVCIGTVLATNSSSDCSCWTSFQPT